MSVSQTQESENLGMTKKLREKWNEALQAVLPIIAIVLVLCFVIAPISSSILLCFLLGAVLLLAGMMLFTLGAELAMSPMGERVGTCLTKSRKLPVVIGLSFLLGFIITISEPDIKENMTGHISPLFSTQGHKNICCRYAHAADGQAQKA